MRALWPSIYPPRLLISANVFVRSMRGEINEKMAEGIDSSKVVVTFITQRYMEKVTGKGAAGKDDNCKFEFDYSLRRKGVDFILPVVMEPSCRNTSQWPGVVGGKLGGILYVDLNSDDEADFNSGMEHLISELKLIGDEDPRRVSERRYSNTSPSLPPHAVAVSCRGSAAEVKAEVQDVVVLPKSSTADVDAL